MIFMAPHCEEIYGIYVAGSVALVAFGSQEYSDNQQSHTSGLRLDAVAASPPVSAP